MRRPRLSAAALLGAGLILSAAAPAADKNAEAAKAALQKVGDFVGVWKGNGEAKVAGKTAGWKESLEWGWKFPKEKTGAAFLALDAPDGKYLTKGELRYDVATKMYLFDATDKAGNETTYSGKLSPRKELVLEAKTKTGDVRKLKLSTVADGARMVVQSEVQAGGKGLAQTEYKVTANKDGSRSPAAAGRRTSAS